MSKRTTFVGRLVPICHSVAACHVADGKSPEFQGFCLVSRSREILPSDSSSYRAAKGMRIGLIYGLAGYEARAIYTDKSLKPV